MTRKILFNTDKYNFVNVFENILMKNYTNYMKNSYLKESFQKRRSTEEFEVLSKTYDELITKPVFVKHWKSFVSDVVKSYFDNRQILIQKLPSFRIFPSKHSVKYVNKITDGYNKHLDSEPPYYHPTFETNFWLPLIECDFLNDFYYHDKEKDWYRRIDARMNELVVFGSDIVHGNRVHNESSNTRCSLDFKALL